MWGKPVACGHMKLFPVAPAWYDTLFGETVSHKDHCREELDSRRNHHLLEKGTLTEKEKLGSFKAMLWFLKHTSCGGEGRSNKSIDQLEHSILKINYCIQVMKQCKPYCPCQRQERQKKNKRTEKKVFEKRKMKTKHTNPQCGHCWGTWLAKGHWRSLGGTEMALPPTSLRAKVLILYNEVAAVPGSLFK